MLRWLRCKTHFQLQNCQNMSPFFLRGGGGHAERKWWEEWKSEMLRWFWSTPKSVFCNFVRLYCKNIDKTHSLTEPNDKIQFHGNYFFKTGGGTTLEGGEPIPCPPSPKSALMDCKFPLRWLVILSTPRTRWRRATFVYDFSCWRRPIDVGSPSAASSSSIRINGW